MINKVILVGRVGADPEIRTGESGIKTARLRLATSESRLNNEQQRIELTEWHNITLFQKLADVADKYVRKGTMLYVEGSIHYRKWQGKDGVERFSTVITTDVMRILSGKAEQTEQAEPQYTPVQYPTTAPATIGEIRVEETEQVIDNTEADDLPF
ncbi:MAG: single-stranded DNA-binding protein [Alistipes sp.]|nr:single-stranded DNA-binding protein [Alistipes sp.]